MAVSRAKELGLRIYSFPEYMYEHARDKERVVIAGSHGKTTITSMILHVMQYWNKPCDYMVGAQLEGFEVMVKMTEEAPVMILEGEKLISKAVHGDGFRISTTVRDRVLREKASVLVRDLARNRS